MVMPLSKIASEAFEAFSLCAAPLHDRGAASVIEQQLTVVLRNCIPNIDISLGGIVLAFTTSSNSVILLERGESEVWTICSSQRRIYVVKIWGDRFYQCS